jgi:hypothetical protein
MNQPNHKLMWCEAYPVRMRLAGWPEPCCLAIREYIERVRKVYTGRAWYSYTKECDRFLAERTLRQGQTLVGFFPRRSQCGNHINVTA